MGSQADYMFDRMIDREIAPDGYCTKIKAASDYAYLIDFMSKLEWTQKNGQVIKLEAMTLSHLRNVVRLVERRNHPKASSFRLYLVHREGSEEPTQ